MARRKTLTMDWDSLSDVDDDDAFFESYSRLSTAVPVDLASSSDDDDDDDDKFDDPRMSFASAVSSVHPRKNRAPSPTDADADAAPDYGIWMAAPTSINERRKRLLHGMGLDDDKEFSKNPSMKLNQTISIKEYTLPSSNINSNTPEKKPTILVTSAPVTVAPPKSSVSAEKKTEHSQSSVHIVPVRSRSEGDIELFSVERSRKEDFIGKVSKQRLRRTATAVAIPRARTTARNRAITRDSEKRSAVKAEDSAVGAFLLIKNLDTGTEFIVNECGENGAWNRLSDLRTGKQLTMEEFERTVGKSRVVSELMKRGNTDRKLSSSTSYISRSLRLSKKRGAAFLKNIRGVASGFIGERERDAVHVVAVPEARSQWVRVRQSGKSHKELSALHLCQELRGHEGCVWAIKFSFDGRYLASAGEDRVVRLWEVQECEVMSLRPEDGSLTPLHPSLLASNEFSSPFASDKKKKGKFGSKRGPAVPEYVHVPETVFSLSEKPCCSLRGHTDDVLDLAWSKSQLLLSSSMDKTVRLWDLETKTCLNTFAHNDYVTCIQFNPIDDDYFISGSLDTKVRIWSISERQVVNWIDIHEMVTAVSYTPDGQGALVGTHKGSCRTYSTQDCVLSQTGTIELRHKKKSQLRKITGFQFAPGKPSQVLVTSGDSRIKILDGSEVVQKYKGFRNSNSQIAASFSPDGRYIISASEDSQVYIWKREEHHKSGGSGKGRNVLVIRSHEHFQCKDVSVAIAWPYTIRGDPPVVPMHHSKRHSKRFQAASGSGGEDTASPSGKRTLPPLPSKKCASPKEDTDSFASSKRHHVPLSPMRANWRTQDEEDLDAISRTDSGIGDSFSSGSSSVRYGDSPSSASWSSSYSLLDTSHASSSIIPSAWGLVIVTAGFGGEIKCYQNLGLPRKMGMQPHLFGGHNSFSHANT
ncbi:WD repeat-containing protein 44 [Cajanus cajan]|uniref:WD repeat-containing protein 44 n=1 Tax=Cajanus cajan TaxID=3821 RepID=UPI0010FB63BE|nr:WD repeat-containing protein 44 [Cajanus cajan]